MKKPYEVKIGERVFRATVLKITGHDPDGAPRSFEILREDEVADISNNQTEFWVVYAPEMVLKRPPRSAA